MNKEINEINLKLVAKWLDVIESESNSQKESNWNVSVWGLSSLWLGLIETLVTEYQVMNVTSRLIN